VAAFVVAGAMATIAPLTTEERMGSVFVTYIFGSWWVGRYAGRLAPAGLAASVVGSGYINFQFEATPQDFFWVWFFMVGAWVTGYLVAERTTRAEGIAAQARELEREQREAAERAVAEERQRIARELHDVVAHSVSVMTVQTGAVRRLLRPEQERERQALESVEATGREALTEMRRLVGLLKDSSTMPEYAPQPGLGTIDSLLETVRAAGLPVELDVDGAPRDLAPGIDLTAYRVVQEALTNALKHAGCGQAWVSLRWGDEQLELEIANDAGSDGGGDGGGYGLVGMRERVSLYGGELESGTSDDGGYVVRARLPLREAAP
jgi:signal transduction histidine kinase